MSRAGARGAPQGWVAALVAALALASAGCGSEEPRAARQATEPGPATGSLARVESRGTLLLPTDLAYPPASFRVKGAERRAGTRCAENQLTAPQVDGYDVAVGEAVAAALSVEPCFVTPSWTELLAGNWADRWDVAFSSIGITRARTENLYFTQPYYATPERFFVRAGGPIDKAEQLEGARIGVCAGCFADLYLQHKLDIPGADVTYQLDDPVIVGYDVERNGLDDVGAGTLPAFLCQETAGEQAIAEGVRLKGLDPAPYEAYIGGALDRAGRPAVKPFFDRVNASLVRLHDDGTLKRLSMRYFEHDYATQAARFDLATIDQTVR
jgi:polar amino acid transport system substrate-binding protein